VLERVDRVQIVVRDLDRADRVWQDLLGARVEGEDSLETFRARRRTLGIGTSAVELLCPTGPGAAADHLAAWGEGLFAAGFSVEAVPPLRERLAACGARWTEEGAQLFLDPSETRGIRTVITPTRPDPEPAGHLLHLYEVSHLVRSWKEARDRHVELFGLDAERFRDIRSEMYGYTGMLLLFDPPTRLDRIEICEIEEPDRAMGRFFRRRGESIYMCYAQCDDTKSLVAHLRERGARFDSPAGSDDPPNLFIHPKSLTGVLMGISRTGHAWTWSGYPELAKRSGNP
jgi:catechol 2,3-dioxygenase-like lactoylglutathione lyase family enzyme